MKATVNGLDFFDAVARVQKATSARNVIPILEGIKLSARGGFLTLTGSDIELTIEKTIKADITNDGEAVVPGKFLFDYVRRMNTGNIDLELNENRVLSIRYQDASSVIKCYNEDEYPAVKALENAQSFTVGQRDLKEMIAKILFCVSTDDTRPVLKGCLLDVVGNTVTGVALDGFRLAKCRKEIAESTADMSMILPARSLSEIQKLLSDNDEPITVFRQRNFISLEIDKTRITSRLLDGDFVNYNQLIPMRFESEVTVNRQQIEESLDRAGLLARSERNNLVKLDIHENITNITSDSDLGHVEEKVIIKNSGKDITIAFNVRYLLDALKSITDDFIKIKLYRPETPAILTNTADDGAYVYLILPIRIR